MAWWVNAGQTLEINTLAVPLIYNCFLLGNTEDALMRGITPTFQVCPSSLQPLQVRAFKHEMFPRHQSLECLRYQS
jgi:hypothetical protein